MGYSITYGGVTLGFTVSPEPGVISFSPSLPPPGHVGDDYLVNASANSGATVTFSVDLSTLGVCTISSSTITFEHVGTCLIDASAAATEDYTNATASQPVTVEKGTGSISFTSTAPSPGTVNGTYDVLTLTNSGLTAELTIDPASVSVCSIEGSLVSFQHVGTCTVDAFTPATSDYTSATTSQSVTVAKATGTVTISSANPGPVAIASTYTPLALSNSGGTIAWSTSSSSSVCTVSAGTFTFTGVGSCVVVATVASTADYTSATTSQSVGVVASAGTITFTSTAPAPGAIGTPYAVTTSTNSGATVTLSIDPSTTADCSIAAGSVTFVHAGTCTIDASAPALGNYTAASASQSVSVAKSTGTVTITSAAPAPGTVGGTYNVATSTNSGAAVTLSIDSTTSSNCSIAGTLVSFSHAGSCLIDAAASATSDYTSATTSQNVSIKGTTSAGHMLAAMPDGLGYWVLASDGSVIPYGTASSHGSLLGEHLNAPLVGIEAAPDGQGYWLVAADGGSVRLRGRPVLRIDRGHPSEPTHCWNGPDSRWPWLLAGGSRRCR